MLMWLACTGKTTDTEPPTPEGFALSAEDYLSLPYAVVGEPAPEDTLTLAVSGERAPHGAVSVSVEGAFAVDGDTSELGEGESRTFTVRYTGGDAPAVETGSVTLTAEGESVTVGLAAVVGDVEIPDASWINDGWGYETTIDLPSAPWAEGGSWDDASVLLFVPEGLFDEEEMGVVTHLHGWGAELDTIVPAQRLVEQTAISGRNLFLVVPQGPVDADSGDFGQLMDPGGFANLTRDALTVLYRDGWILRPELDSIAITSHSGGYQAAAAIIEDGGLPITAVHLFDSLYAETDTFQAFVEGGGVLRSVYTASGGTDGENEALRATLEAEGISVSRSFTDEALAGSTVTIGSSDASHTGCVQDERAYARWLSASTLPHRPSAPPELVSTISDGDNTIVSWRADVGDPSLRYRVEGSDDNSRWTLLTDTDQTSATVQNAAWIRILTTDSSFGSSDASDTYGATGTDWLVVDGFDRALDGSYDQPTHTFAAIVGNALDAPFSVASNEAIATGEVSLTDFSRVLWLLGDESTSDRTFNDAEMDAIEAYVNAGGVFVASGSEIGYATDADWLSSVLHATYVADDAGTTQVEGWLVGARYVEDYPDVLDGDTTLWRWSTAEPAAVSWERRVVVIGFGVENLDDGDLNAAMDSLTGWVE